MCPAELSLLSQKTMRYVLTSHDAVSGRRDEMRPNHLTFHFLKKARNLSYFLIAAKIFSTNILAKDIVLVQNV